MSKPGDDVLLEVELLLGVQFARAAGHDVRVAGNLVGHVEVVHVFNQRGSV